MMISFACCIVPTITLHCFCRMQHIVCSLDRGA